MFSAQKNMLAVIVGISTVLGFEATAQAAISSGTEKVSQNCILESKDSMVGNLSLEYNLVKKNSPNGKQWRYVLSDSTVRASMVDFDQPKDVGSLTVLAQITSEMKKVEGPQEAPERFTIRGELVRDFSQVIILVGSDDNGSFALVHYDADSVDQVSYFRCGDFPWNTIHTN